jgi:PIN domain nuclease of toxin-antitoxin system
MNILMDTHIALWSMYNDEKLSETSRKYISDIKNVVFVSLASAWEVEIKHSIGKLDVPSDVFLNDCEAMGFCLLPIRKEHITALKNIDAPTDGHKDPFDRLLLAQAESENFEFLTEDSKILGYSSNHIIR